MLGMFFLPAGYDALFMAIMKLTGSYWITDIIFYLISAFFLGLYFLYSKINPFDHFKEKIIVFYIKLKYFWQSLG